LKAINQNGWKRLEYSSITLLSGSNRSYSRNSFPHYFLGVRSKYTNIGRCLDRRKCKDVLPYGNPFSYCSVDAAQNDGQENVIFPLNYQLNVSNPKGYKSINNK